MRQFAIIFALLCGSAAAQVTCVALGPTATGSGSGLNWSNMKAYIPTPVRGTRYYLADGTGYGSLDFTTAVSSTSTVEIRKAQSYDFGRTSDGCSNDISSGWNPATMGSGQAIFNSTSLYFGHMFYLEVGFITINGNGQQAHGGCGGAVGNDPTLSPAIPSDCGIKIDDTVNCTTDIIGTVVGAKTGVNIKYLEFAGCGNATTEGQSVVRFDNCASCSMTHSYLRHFGSVCTVMGGTTNFIWDDNYLFRNQIINGGNPNHGQCLQDFGDNGNIDVSRNVFRDLGGTAIIIAWVGSGSVQAGPYKFYDNVIWNTPGFTPLFPAANGLLACINGFTCNNVTMSQNTIGLMGSSARTAIDSETGGTYTVQNNIWYSSSNDADLAPHGTFTETNNSYLASGASCPSGTANVCNNTASDPFNGSATGDFTLAADGSNVNNRISLSAPFTADINGLTFTTDRGAYQFSSLVLPGCGPTIFYGPPNYPCGSPSTVNPGQVTYYFQGRNPQALVNTSNSAISPCTANCLQYAGTGDQFNTGWQTGVGAGNGGNILLGGGVGTVNTSSTSVTWVSGTVFNTAWSGTMTIAGVARTISSCTSTTACTLTTSAGTLTGVGYSVKGTAFGVAAWNSATVATLMSAPGTQTGVTMLDQTACIPVTALDHMASTCQNSVSHDPTLPGYVAGSNLITWIMDQSAGTNGLPTGNCSSSGGDNDHGWSRPNGTYVWCVNSGGLAQVFQISTALGYAQVVNSSAACGAPPPGVLSALGTGMTSDTRYYHTSGSQVLQADLSGSGCTLILGTDSLTVDFEGSGICPGIPSGLHIDSILGVSGDGTNLVDDTFSAVLAPPPYTQGSGDWKVNYSKTRGCAATNYATGQWWAFCTSSCNASTPASGTFATGGTNCFGSSGSTGQGLHNLQTDTRGNWDFVSGDNWPSPQGGCVGPTFLVEQKIGASNNVDAFQFNMGNHQSVGIDNIISNRSTGMKYAANNNVPNPVLYANFPLSNGTLVQDAHNGLPGLCNGYYSDNCAWIGATDTVNSTQLSGCTGSGAFIAAVYCPTALSNMMYLILPPVATPFPALILTFAHSGSCGGVGNGCADQIPDPFGSLDAICMPSPHGDMEICDSSMWHQLGYDKNAAPFVGAFIIYFGQPKLTIAPATGLFAHVTQNFNAHFPISGGSK